MEARSYPPEKLKYYESNLSTSIGKASELKITAGHHFSMQFCITATQKLILIVTNCTDSQSKFYVGQPNPKPYFQLYHCVCFCFCFVVQGRTVTLKLKTVFFEVKSRAVTLPSAASKAEELFRPASELLRAEIKACSPAPLRLRLMGE